jgi:hypothetical protein
MAAYLEGLLQLYSKEMADGGVHSRLDADDLLQMMQACCSVVSTLPSVDQIRAAVQRLLEPVGVWLGKIGFGKPPPSKADPRCQQDY